MTADISAAEMLLRIAVGAALGGVIGYERDRHGRPVGLRTHLIVSMTAATFMVVSAHFASFQHYVSGGVVEVDGSRIAASVVSGIGFLAGGAILRTGATIQGLTTAAGLWLVTAIGLSAGAGMFVVSACVTLMGVVALTLLRRFEDKNDQMIRRRVSVVVSSSGTGRADAIVEKLTALGVTVTELEFEHEVGHQRLAATLDVQIPSTLGTTKLLEALQSIEGVERLHLKSPG